MTPSIYIAVACHNRKSIAKLCLPTLAYAARPNDVLALYNDGSTEYDAAWLSRWSNVAIQINEPIGIQLQRRQHLHDFLKTDRELLYFTDHDCIHDPHSLYQAVRLQTIYGLPTCLYDTLAHSGLPGNTLEDDPASEVIIRAVAPGVSYLLTRDHVNQIKPFIDQLNHFDWEIPAILGGRFAVSRVGYIDHIGWGGQRHPEAEGVDEGDRVKRPTSWLIAKRAEVVARLKQHATP